MSEMTERCVNIMRDARRLHWNDELQVKAIIAAMHKPTPEMIEAGENAGCGVSDFRTAAELTWQAMIDAALAEKETK